MVSIGTARKLAMSLPETEERDHFGSPSFRVKGKIFAQLSNQGDEIDRALIKVTVADQTALVMSAPDIFTAVPQWGKHGWTHVRLAGVEKSCCATCSFNHGVWLRPGIWPMRPRGRRKRTAEAAGTSKMPSSRRKPDPVALCVRESMEIKTLGS
jgi:hypothetical protein